MISPEFPTTADSGVSQRRDTTAGCGMRGDGRKAFARAIVASNSRADPHHDRILRNRGNPAQGLFYTDSAEIRQTLLANRG
jgi:hypothetical protein